MASNSKRDRAVGAGSWLVAVATVLFGLLAVTRQASSADLSPGPIPAPAVAPAGYNWNGLYLGLNAGCGIRDRHDNGFRGRRRCYGQC